MTGLRLGKGACLVIVAVWLATGLCVGLFVAWILWPVRVTNVDVIDLNPSSQDDYIVLTAGGYAYDQDLDKASARLDLLRDNNIGDRLTQLAKTLAADNKQSDAAFVAALAIALGSEDEALTTIAATATPTITVTPIPTETRLPTVAATAKSAIAPATNIPQARTATPRPRSTVTPIPAPIAATQWLPSFPGEWPPGTNFQSANVASGQKFWHLVKALYCDDRDERNNCSDLPGGSTGTSIYVMLIGAGGWRESAPLKIVKDDGSLATVDDLGPEKPASDMCNCNYSFMANHWPIQVGGSYPSDTIRGLGLYSVRMKLPQAHSKYFLTFQLVTR